MTEVALIGATFYGNRGAEAMLTTTIAQLRKRSPGLRFNVYSYYPVRDRDLVADESVRIFSATPAYLVTVLGPTALLYALLGLPGLRALRRFLPQSIRALARSQVLICLAGVSFIDGREKFLPFNIATILPAMIVGVPVVKFAQALGPFRNPFNRVAAKLVLSHCRQVFARGSVSQSHLQESFTPGFYARANDIAFLFDPGSSLSQGDPKQKSSLEKIGEFRSKGVPIIGICPSVVVEKRRLRQGKDYAHEIGSLVTNLLKDGKAVVLFPNATRENEPSKAHNNDLPLLQRIADQIRPDLCENFFVATGSLNAADVHRIIHTCDVIATSRFHAMIGALVCQKPILVMGWSHKYLEVMELFGLEHFVFDDSVGSVDTLMNGVKEAFRCAPQIRATIADRLPTVQELACVQIDYVKSMVG